MLTNPELAYGESVKLGVVKGGGLSKWSLVIEVNATYDFVFCLNYHFHVDI